MSADEWHEVAQHRSNWLINYTAMLFNVFNLHFQNVANSHRKAQARIKRDGHDLHKYDPDLKSLSPSGMQYKTGNSAQLCQSSPKAGHYLTQAKRSRFPCFHLCSIIHVTLHPDNPACICMKQRYCKWGPGNYGIQRS